MPNKKINQFPSDVSINGNELILIMDNNVTKKMIAGNFMNFVFDNVGVYYSSFISFSIKSFKEYFNYGVIPDFKFRFIIEYYQ